MTYESTFWSENCPFVVHSQDDDIRQNAVASESCHESILPAAVVKFFGECENMRKLESRQHRCFRCHLCQTAWSNDYSCRVEGVAKSSASTHIDARSSVCVDGRRRAWCEWAFTLWASTSASRAVSAVAELFVVRLKQLWYKDQLDEARWAASTVMPRAVVNLTFDLLLRKLNKHVS